MPDQRSADVGTPGIRVEGLSVRFGALEALSEVSLTIDAPATGLLGANGAGKSTLMKVLLGLIEPDAGTVDLFGRRVGPRDRHAHRRLGYMPERDCLPRDMTARDLVVHMGELRGMDHRSAVLRASEVLFQVGLEEERSRLIGTFSTGMAQRTKLAQALIHSPDLVVLDEPTNGLDPGGREEMLGLVRRLSRDLGIGVIISSHVLEDIARTCDAVIVLREGTVAHAGMMRDLVGLDPARGVRVRVGAGLDRFASLVRARGLEVSESGPDAVVVRGGDPDAVLDAVRDAAAEAAVSLREMRPEGGGLEDALVEVLG